MSKKRELLSLIQLRNVRFSPGGYAWHAAAKRAEEDGMADEDGKTDLNSNVEREESIHGTVRATEPQK